MDFFIGLIVGLIIAYIYISPTELERLRMMKKDVISLNKHMKYKIDELCKRRNELAKLPKRISNNMDIGLLTIDINTLTTYHNHLNIIVLTEEEEI
jgi:hypothetical protein